MEHGQAELQLAQLKQQVHCYRESYTAVRVQERSPCAEQTELGVVKETKPCSSVP